MATKINDLGRFRLAIDHALQHGSVMGVEVPPSLVPGNKQLGELTKGELQHIASELKGAGHQTAKRIPGGKIKRLLTKRWFF
jgi:hypothetical protein